MQAIYSPSKAGPILRGHSPVPPHSFRQPIYIAIAPGKHCPSSGRHQGVEGTRRPPTVFIHHLKTLINMSDAIDPGTSTVIGVNVSMTRGYGDNLLLAVFVGMLTGAEAV